MAKCWLKRMRRTVNLFSEGLEFWRSFSVAEVYRSSTMKSSVSVLSVLEARTKCLKTRVQLAGRMEAFRLLTLRSSSLALIHNDHHRHSLDLLFAFPSYAPVYDTRL